MLGYIISDEPGEADALLGQVAKALIADGVRLTGVVQHTTREDGAKQDMALTLLPDGPRIGISQDLGKGATGCSLDPEGLEHAAGLVAVALDQQPQLLVLNKFGKQEAEGHGFRAAIGAALSQGTPVLIGVGRAKLPLFLDFCGELGEELPKQGDALLAWSRAQIS
jgi:nucleoside-triphosphatase THEP1